MYLRCQVTLVFTAVTSKNDVTLCNLNVNITLISRTERRSIVASTSLNLSRNSLMEKCYFIASSSLKIKCG